MRADSVQARELSPPVAGRLRLDLERAPLTVFWETTRACDLFCAHCRAAARPGRDPRELTTEEARRLIDQVAELGSPVFVVTGGDPLERPDLFVLLAHAVARGIAPAVTPSGTPLLTERALRRMREVGVRRIALSLDGPDAATHDGFRRQQGSFAYTLAGLHHARECGLATQVNTTITGHNANRLDEIAELVADSGAATWSAFFLVGVGRGKDLEQLDARGFEEVFARLYDLSKRFPFRIRTTAAPHYRRFVAQRNAAANREGRKPSAPTPPFPMNRGITDGRGIAFVSHTGDVYPSGFLPIAAGNVRRTPLPDLYRTAPLFRLLRDSDRLGGKCRSCEFRNLCGGSRARAFSVHGNVMAEEPCCAYEPKGPRVQVAAGPSPRAAEPKSSGSFGV
jgi:radical SAM protein